jgi:hypothetical protein
VRGRAPDDGDGLGEGHLLNLGEEGGVRVGGGRSYYVDRDRGRDTVLCNNIFLKLLAPPFALLRKHAEEETRISSSSLPRLHAMPLPLHAMPAVAVPAVREYNRVRRQPVRFAP